MIIYKSFIFKLMSEQWMPKKPNFGSPPPGYIAGLGRGATGFITRTDVGPAKKDNEIKVSQVDEAAFAEIKYDNWSGYKGALFDKRQLDEQDRQAEEAYDYCEERLDERRLKSKEEKVKEELQKYETKNKNKAISEQYTDLKRQLGKLTEQEWQKIPELKDSVTQRRKKDKYTPVPDNMLVGLLTDKKTTSVINDSETHQYSHIKGSLLKNKLDIAQDQANSFNHNIDKIGYLSQLTINKIDEQMVGDLKKARLLHESALELYPKNEKLWLSAARIQQFDGKLQKSRQILKKGLKFCADSEDIWIELGRIQRAQESKQVLIEGLRRLPQSEKIWLQYSKKQNDNKEKKSKILRKALENIPQSLKLWKQLIQLSDIEEAKKLLLKAVECLPKEIQLWLGLAKLQNYESAKAILNKARKANPLSLQIWISAAKLQETKSENSCEGIKKIQVILEKGKQILKKNGNSVSRNQFIEEALFCEKSNNIRTCQTIIKMCINMGLTEQELNNVIVKDAQLYQNEYKSYYTTKFIYKYGVLLTHSIVIFERMLEFEHRQQRNQKQKQIEETLLFGINIFPEHSSFWVAIINKLINKCQYEEAISVINKACQKSIEKQKELLLLKKVQILKKQNKLLQAKVELQTLAKLQPLGNSIFELIKLEYESQNYQKSLKICEQQFKIRQPELLWVMLCKINSKISSYKITKLLFEKSIEKYPKSLTLWKLYAQYEIQNNFVNRARTIINEALTKNPKNQQLFITLVQFEIQYGNKKQIYSCLQKALKECPKSGYLWGLSVQQQPHNTRKIKASAAIKQFDNHNSQINCSVSKVFWKQNKVQKAKRWLEESLKNDIENGDLWAHYYLLIKQKFPQQMTQFMTKFNQVEEIKKGRKWNQLMSADFGWKFSKQDILISIAQKVKENMKAIN